jgi:hypothetical protein
MKTLRSRLPMKHQMDCLFVIACCFSHNIDQNALMRYAVFFSPTSYTTLSRNVPFLGLDTLSFTRVLNALILTF